MNINVYYLGLLLHNNGSFSGLPTAFFLGMTIPPRKNQPQHSGRRSGARHCFRLDWAFGLDLSRGKTCCDVSPVPKNTIDDVFASGPKTVLVKSTCLLERVRRSRRGGVGGAC